MPMQLGHFSCAAPTQYARSHGGGARGGTLIHNGSDENWKIQVRDRCSLADAPPLLRFLLLSFHYCTGLRAIQVKSSPRDPFYGRDASPSTYLGRFDEELLLGEWGCLPAETASREAGEQGLENAPS